MSADPFPALGVDPILQFSNNSTDPEGLVGLTFLIWRRGCFFSERSPRLRSIFVVDKMASMAHKVYLSTTSFAEGH